VIVAAIFNHLWQSTVFALLAGLLSVVLRQNHARTWHWIWMAVSAKFLIPFSLLISAGSHLQWTHAMPVVPPRLPVAVAQVSQPFKRIRGPRATRSDENLSNRGSFGRRT
jgi:hypothetical protein